MRYVLICYNKKSKINAPVLIKVFICNYSLFCNMNLRYIYCVEKLCTFAKNKNENIKLNET